LSKFEAFITFFFLEKNRKKKYFSRRNQPVMKTKKKIWTKIGFFWKEKI